MGVSVCPSKKIFPLHPMKFIKYFQISNTFLEQIINFHLLESIFTQISIDDTYRDYTGCPVVRCSYFGCWFYMIIQVKNINNFIEIPTYYGTFRDNFFSFIFLYKIIFLWKNLFFFVFNLFIVFTCNYLTIVVHNQWGHLCGPQVCRRAHLTK